MRETPNSESIREQGVQLSTSNIQTSASGTASDLKHRTSNIFWRVLDLIIAAIFIYAGVLKVRDPVQFAHDIDHYKILPWPISVALAFYLPWLDIFCVLGLVFRRQYRGALSILTVLIAIFIIATVAAKVRGLDITCGCFGHASQHWNFPAHLGFDSVLFGLVIFLLLRRSRNFA